MTAPSLVPAVNECITQLYALRTARELMSVSALHGDLAEAKRHDDRRWYAAECLLTIIRERPNGFEAYRIAHREYRA